MRTSTFSPTLYAIKKRKSQPHEPKLVKEYVCPNAENEMNKIKTAYNNVYSA